MRGLAFVLFLLVVYDAAAQSPNYYNFEVLPPSPVIDAVGVGGHEQGAGLRHVCMHDDAQAECQSGISEGMVRSGRVAGCPGLFLGVPACSCDKKSYAGSYFIHLFSPTASGYALGLFLERR